MNVTEVDPYDDAALAAFHAFEVAASADPYDVTWTEHELRVALRDDDPWARRSLLLAHDDAGEVVASAQVEVPLRDNTDRVWADVRVAPGRAEDGGRFVDELVDRTRIMGRRVLETGARWPAGAADEGPFAALLRTRGFTLGLVEAHRVLDLPVDVDHLRAVADQTAPASAAYQIRSWSGAVPEDVVDAYAALRAILPTEAPSGDMGWEDNDFSAERVRHDEAVLAAQERTSYVTIAVAPDGTVAGHTEAIVAGTDPESAFQWDTLVLGEHRGHRLGLTLKAANLLAAADALVGRRWMHTFNAAGNTPMIAVNERLGFRLVAEIGAFQRVV